MRKLLQPQLQPSTEYSYLRFIGPPQSNFVEIWLPDDSSYIIEFMELKQFLKNCDVTDYEGLADFVYNFGNVLWNRQDQLYYPVNSKKMMPEEDLTGIDRTLEMPYVFV